MTELTAPDDGRRGHAGPDRRYILPNFIERTSHGDSRHAIPYTKLFEERIIFLGVQIDDASADDVMAQLLCLESDGPRPRHLDLHQLARAARSRR